MPEINIDDLENLQPTGVDLFDDPETFMLEVTDEENAVILGGCNVSYKTEQSARCCACSNHMTLMLAGG
ncbi:hypothetical protein PCC8801_1978 [Rippkaea orientalis PCC 8801]|uniref:Uncharacterized protein n=1 Tax=Rippkaea orientalis (strain PCC 8801 / RF-1) TaxID=41431 RepID=B7JYT9_RIPO1|nr:hypothetical protein [Rippkaea orientalis]ACK66016.1 hypothetical protein PCC8801_1978 [Rippkaea orientalis PCC 8801]